LFAVSLVLALLPSSGLFSLPQRWTYKEDLALKSGVKEFGVGNWAKILVHGDFNNRTSVMLKDRWRTLCRINQG
ncbi:TERF1 factor, partial [Jacana jacana]|nr:TERF1 factor [Jacana jacana]